jgi:hypothetical protein
MKPASQERACLLPGLVLIAALAWILTIPTSAAAAPGWGRPTWSSPIAITIDGRLIWATNPSHDSVSAIRADTHRAQSSARHGQSGRGAVPEPLLA